MTSLSRFSVVVLTLFGTMALPAAAETSIVYRISPGDTIEIGIASLSDRPQRAVVQVDGTIVLPDVGAVSVGGLTGPELQSRMQTILPTKIFHIRMPDGREQMAVVRPSDVTAIIAE